MFARGSCKGTNPKEKDICTEGFDFEGSFVDMVGDTDLVEQYAEHETSQTGADDEDFRTWTGG